MNKKQTLGKRVRALLGCILGWSIATLSPAVSMPYRTHVVIQKSHVLLSDVVDLAPQTLNPILMTLPRPGQSLSLEPQQIIQTAATHGMTLVLDQPHTRIHIERACGFLTTSDLQDFLNTEGQSDASSVHLLDQQNIRIPVSSQKPQLILEQMDMVQHTQRFQAMIRYPVDDESALSETINVTGRIVPLIVVPVLKKALAAGQTILQEHVTSQSKPQDHILAGMIHHADDLVGRVALCALRADQPIRVQDVKRPVVIKKGQILHATCVQRGLSLSVKVRSLEEGSIGDTIKVLNVDSKKEIYGIVHNAQTIAVSVSTPIVQTSQSTQIAHP